MRSGHSQQRGDEGRPVSQAFNDAQRARQSDVFIQPDGRYVVRGIGGREHIFELIPDIKLDDDLEEMELEDKLSDFTAELVASKNNSLFLERLFATDAGQWLDVDFLSDRLEQITSQLQELRNLCEGNLKVTWLEHPTADSGYCLILFYMEALHWNNLAL